MSFSDQCPTAIWSRFPRAQQKSSGLSYLARVSVQVSLLPSFSSVLFLVSWSASAPPLLSILSFPGTSNIPSLDSPFPQFLEVTFGLTCQNSSHLHYDHRITIPLTFVLTKNHFGCLLEIISIWHKLFLVKPFNISNMKTNYTFSRVLSYTTCVTWTLVCFGIYYTCFCCLNTIKYNINNYKKYNIQKENIKSRNLLPWKSYKQFVFIRNKVSKSLTFL